MSGEVYEHVENNNPENGGESQGLAIPLEALNRLNSPAVGSPPCISPPTKTVYLGEHVPDSGYGSITSTPDHKHTPTILRKAGQTSFIRQAGLSVSNVSMEAGTKRRFLQVQLEIEKMLLELIRKLKSGPGRHKPIAIRPMMLGKTDADADAKSYMVVICSENIAREVQDFFDDPLVKSLCDPGDDDIPSFRTLVIGHALRLRASTSGITVQSDAVNRLHDGTKTFCGMPIRLHDEFGHSRNATFGGIIKVASTDEGYQLYGLTAGHMIRDHQVITVEDDSILATSNRRDLTYPIEPIRASEDQSRTTSQTMSNEIDHLQDDLENWYFSNEHNLGQVIDAYIRETPVHEEQRQMQPNLDWALFELNAHRPNQLAFPGMEHCKGDLHLPLSTTHHGKEEIAVSMLCASQGVKHGVLSTTPARVLLDPGDSFINAYTLSLECSEVSDGDSGSWVVDQLHLEVYGHVVADDFFGDAYVIPMGDILADIQRCFDAQSVDLPSALDIISIATVQQPSLFTGPEPRDRTKTQAVTGVPEDVPQLSNTSEYPSWLGEGHKFPEMTPAELSEWSAIWYPSPCGEQYAPLEIAPADFLEYPPRPAFPYTDMLAQASNPGLPCESIMESAPSSSATHDSGYSSVASSGPSSRERDSGVSQCEVGRTIDTSSAKVNEKDFEDSEMTGSNEVTYL